MVRLSAIGIVAVGCKRLSDKYQSAQQTLIIMRSPAIVELRAPCEVKSEGSKLLVSPLNIDFGTFTNAVQWNYGIPGYLAGIGPRDKGFNFDLSALRVRRDVVLRIERVTERTSDDMVLLLTTYGSLCGIEIISCGKGTNVTLQGNQESSLPRESEDGAVLKLKPKPSSRAGRGLSPKTKK